MASYNSNQLSGIGSPIEALTGGSTYTFAITSSISGSTYFTLETVRNSIGFYDSTTPTTAVGNLENLTNITGLVSSSYIFSVVVQPGGGSFTFTPANNIVASGSLLRGTGGINLEIVSSVVVPSFVSTWRTTNTSAGSSNSNQVRLPLRSTGTYNFTVNWGDGNSNVITTWNQAEATHTYSSSGDYTITITGTISGFGFGNAGDRLKMLSITSFGPVDFGPDFGVIIPGVFQGCTNLNLPTVTDVPDLSGMISTSGMFGLCTNLTTINNINSWDVSTITSMDAMFRGTGFNQDISSWDVSNVTSMTSMFRDAGFNQNISSWDVSNVNDMQYMFAGATIFNQPIGNWNVSNVTNMQNMFQQATAFNQPIGNWNVSNVTIFTSFMLNKTATDYSTANLNAIYNGWSSRPVQAGITISFGSIKYTAAGQAGRNVLTGAPNNWVITDGGV